MLTTIYSLLGMLTVAALAGAILLCLTPKEPVNRLVMRRENISAVIAVEMLVVLSIVVGVVVILAKV